MKEACNMTFNKYNIGERSMPDDC